MTRLLNHARSNAIAYLALFFALGGGGAWAASSLPRAASTSHARAASADPRPGGYILAWAHVAANGKIQGGSPGARVWGGFGSEGIYQLTWRKLRIPGGCGTLVSPGGGGAGGVVRTATAFIARSTVPHGLTSDVGVQVFNEQGQGTPGVFTVEIVC